MGGEEVDNGIPEYRQILQRERIDKIHQVLQDNIRHNIWYCPNCGVPYQQKWGMRDRCDECGTKLEVN